MKLTIELYINLTEAYSWQEGYDHAYPYNFELSPYEAASKNSWTIGSREIEIDFDEPSADIIPDIMIKGYEQVIKEARAEAFAFAELYQDKIDKLRALPAPEKEDDSDKA